MSGLDLVWTSSLMNDTSPMVHEARRRNTRPARTYMDHVVAGFRPRPGLLVQVETTPCGQIRYGRIVDPLVPSNDSRRYLDGRSIGITMRTVFAEAIGARRCRRCWPVTAAPQSAGKP